MKLREAQSAATQVACTDAWILGSRLGRDQSHTSDQSHTKGLTQSDPRCKRSVQVGIPVNQI